mmetsp:Transcript_8108/g.18532  ORF Transcript_8108/g.18532 Transcript_8108/m.18532 type:complete len:201 (+) Transcript_8108:728-1330(+)
MARRLRLRTSAISAVINGKSSASVRKAMVQSGCISLLKPISSPWTTAMLSNVPSSKAAATPSPTFCCAFVRLRCWCRTQYCTASSTVGKNHCSPMKDFSPAFRIVRSTRLPTMARATRTPRLRKSLTTSSMACTAVESTLMTGVISRTMYSVGFTPSRSATYASNMSFTKEALAKYKLEPMRAMKTFGTKEPELSCFVLR